MRPAPVRFRKERVESAVPEHVRAFVAQHIDSVEQLEVLLLVRDHAERRWSADQVAAELRIDPRSAAQRLEDLRDVGLLAGAEPAFSYRPRTPALADQTAELASMYQTHRVAIIAVIFSRPSERIRSFADAFRIRRGENDG